MQNIVKKNSKSPQKMRETVNKENSQNRGKTEDRDEKGRFVKGRKKTGGTKPGSKHFDTIFEEAIREIVKSEKLPIKDPEKEMMIKGVIEALKGNFPFWKALAELRYGKPKESVEVELKRKMVILDD